MREPDTGQGRAGLEERKWTGESEGMGDKEEGGASHFPHHIVDF